MDERQKAKAALDEAARKKQMVLAAHATLRSELNARISKERAAATKEVNDAAKALAKIDKEKAIADAMKAALNVVTPPAIPPEAETPEPTDGEDATT